MKHNFEKANIGKHGLLESLFFDEVKIKEGLVFDPSSFEPIGFADIENNIHDLELPCASKQSKNDEKPEENWLHMFYNFFTRVFLQNLSSLAFFFSQKELQH